MPARRPTPLESVLAGSLLEIVMAIDAVPDDEIDPDVAVRLQEGVGAAIHDLGRDDQETFIEAALQYAATETESGRAIREALVALGLADTK